MSTIITGGTTESRRKSLGNLLSTSDPDQILLSPDPEETNIGIEAVRSLITSLSTRPIAHEHKTAILEQSHLLTEQAQNALLKTLEEPPGEAEIFLLTENIELFLPTIISRCQIIQLPPDSTQDPEKIPELEKMDLGEKFKLAAEIAKDRASAIKWLDHLLVSLHSAKMFAPTSRVIVAKRHLLANANTRLTIENLFLNW